MYFNFKKFTVRQRDSAMKVGTDGLLLATSTPLSADSKKVLDIGSGTGLISLVLAQRNFKVEITAIEIDEGAANETAYNFAQSPFSERLGIQQTSFQDYYLQKESSSFDLIICNPPFFKGSQAEGSRQLARNSDSLAKGELLKGVNKLLTADGQFSLIIPSSNEEKFIHQAKKHSLFPFEVLRIRGRKESKIIRSIIHFGRVDREYNSSEIYIEVDKRHQYSLEYIRLTRDFLSIFD